MLKVKLMQTEILRKLKEQIAIFGVGALPGILIIWLVIITRLTGYMQYLEWLAFDSFLRLRPPEPIDERILILGIDEKDIHSLKTYPVPDKEIAALLNRLQTYSPRVIGLDIVRDLPVEPGHAELVNTFKRTKNLIGIEKVLPDKFNPPPDLPPEQVGFVDQIPDNDGKLRRSLLGTPTPQGYKFAFSLHLAKVYLAHQGISLENGKRDSAAMRFADTELPRLLPNSGVYVRIDTGGIQLLLNFRSGRERFRTLSLNDIKTGNFQPEWIRDRIVIIGMTTPSAKDFTTTSAIPSAKSAPPGQVYGVEIHAHAVSQIISATLENRPLLNTWSDNWEYIWIFGWGILGICLAKFTKSPLKNLLFVGIANTSLIAISYLLLILGWWVPVIPAILVLAFNGVAMTALYQYDQAWHFRIKAHKIVIERTFETIHNGPLQTLGKALKRIRDQDLPPHELLVEIEKELEKLNHEMQGIYEFLLREPISQDRSLYLGTSLELNLQDPIHELLYQVYSHTLERDFPCFKTIRVKIRTFDSIDEQNLNFEQKRGLCRFLEEALCNVGKHAAGVTRLEVTFSPSEGWYILRIVDDGLGVNSFRKGRGTQQFRNLARELKGKFRLIQLSPRGTLCELSWPMSRFWHLS